MLTRLSGVPLFRVRGILVEAHWSVAIPIVLYVGLLARTRFLGRYSELSNETIAAMSVVSVLLMAGSLLLHEFGHSFAARREGLDADRITLWGLGGLAWIGNPHSPGVAFRVTAAGPLVSALLAVLFAGLGWAEPVLGVPDAVVGVTVLLAQANAVLFAFNLVPVYPLDGGRILHSALWRLRGPVFAWVWAMRIGTAIALTVLVFGAVAPLVGILTTTGEFNLGLSVMVDGAILLWLSHRVRVSAETSRAVRRAALVGDLLEASEERAVAGPHMTIAEFLELTPPCPGYATACSTVVENGQTVGIVSRGIARRVPPEQREETTVGDVMVQREDTVVLKRETPVEAAFQELGQPARTGIVLDGRKVTAIVLGSDLADVMLQSRDRARGMATSS